MSEGTHEAEEDFGYANTADTHSIVTVVLHELEVAQADGEDQLAQRRMRKMIRGDN